MPKQAENPYTQTYQHFLEQTKDHQFTVIHDDGLYRHLRVQAPGTRMWSWDVTTWPGHLATSGDIGSGYVFSRVEDMLEFFKVQPSSRSYYSDGAPCIDFRYWAEKIIGVGEQDRTKRYSKDRFLQLVTAALEEDYELGIAAQTEHDMVVKVAKQVCTRHDVDYEDYLRDLRIGSRLADLDIDENDREEVEYFGREIPELSPVERRLEIITDAGLVDEYDEAAHQWLIDHEEFVGTDTWEWDLRDFDVHFVFACYAIELTSRRWSSR